MQTAYADIMRQEQAAGVSKADSTRAALHSLLGKTTVLDPWTLRKAGVVLEEKACQG